MRSLLLSILMPIAIIWGLTKGIRGVIVFNWLTFMRPQDFVWSFWSNRPMFRIGLAVMVLSLLFNRELKPKFNLFIFLYVIFYFWIIISSFNGFSKKISFEYFQSYIMITPIAFIFLNWAINSIKDLKKIMWIMGGCVSLITFKVSISTLVSGNFHLSEVTSGFVGDNNTLALCICLCTGIIIGLKSDLKNKYARYFVNILVVSNVFLILVTQSRGAFITISIVILIAVITNKKPIRNLLFISLIVIVGYSILPKSMFQRLQTLENVEDDESAMSRVEMWKRAMVIAKNDPLTGIGVGCFRFYNHIMYPGEPNFVTHSTYFQILSSTGFPGILIYLSIIFLTIIRLHRCRRFLYYLHNNQDLYWAVNTSLWMRNVLIGYLFGSAFLDMLVYDIPWYFIFYANILTEMVNKEIISKNCNEISEIETVINTNLKIV